ncbi:VOC family protein [Streptomyces sp. WAC06614]|uniref:VOC family protein n=1 Tax=Streptomyces sp. WAC06614 TaxID=2487416 RepID=UPI000F76D7E3|nr:VOC family protein [Streptomyces sp. WAC06614]RSS73337.1 glyoxalase [Streptomyces sp. WAC06614]
MTGPVHGTLHHVEVWVPSLERTTASFGPLLTALGWTPYQEWEHGRSWRLGTAYLVFEQSPAMTAGDHDRLRPGLNHLAFHVEDAAAVDRLVDLLTAGAVSNGGWALLFPDRHPHAGGPGTYAAYLADADGFEVELVAIS